MSEKSHVSIEQKACPVTGKVFESGGLLLDTRVEDGELKKSLERNTVTGWQICPEVQEQLDKGFIALVGADEKKSEKLENGNITPEGAYRTGDVVYMKKEVAAKMFNMEIKHPFFFVDEGVISMLKEKQKELENE